MRSERDRQAKTDACLVPLCPLASMVPVALAVICLVAAWRGKEGGSTPLESLINRFRRRAEPAPLREAITSYAQKEKQSQQKSSFPKPASDPPERGWNRRRCQRACCCRALRSRSPAGTNLPGLEARSYAAPPAGAIDAGRSITRQSLQKTQSADSRAVIRKRPARPGPKKFQ